MNVLARLGVKAPNPRRLLERAAFPLVAPTTPGGVDPVPTKAKLGASYDTDWARKPAAQSARRMIRAGVLRPTTRLLAHPVIHGLDRLADLLSADEVAPVIFCANHHSHVDTPLVLTSLPGPWANKVFVGAAADYFFRNRVSSAASALALNAIPIERTTIARRSAQQSARLIADGYSMVIFPEGGRSPDGWGQAFRGGAAFLAERCDVAVVPVHINGTGKIWSKGTKKITPGKTSVTFGKPMRINPGGDVRAFATDIENAVAALADEATTDWYSARRRVHAGRTPSLSGPGATGWRRAWALGSSRSNRRSNRWPFDS